LAAMSHQSFELFPFREFQDKYHASQDSSIEVDQSMIVDKFTQQVQILQQELSEKDKILGQKDTKYQNLSDLYNNCEEKRRKLTDQLDLAMVKFDELTEDFNRQADAMKDGGGNRSDELEALQVRLESKSRENTRLQDMVRVLTEEKSGLETSIATIQTSHGEMSSVFDQYQAQKNAFADVMQQKTLEIEDFKLQVRRLKSENDELNRVISRNGEDLTQQTLSAYEVKGELELLRSQVAKLTSRNSQLEQERAEFHSELTGAKSTLNQTSMDSQWLKEQLKEKTALCESFQSQLQRESSSKETTEISKRALGESNMDLKNRLISLERERDELRERVTRTAARLSDIQTGKTQSDSNLTNQMESIRNLREKVEAYEELIATLEGESKRKDMDLLNCATLLQEHKAEISTLQKKLEDSESRVAEFQKLQTQHLHLEMDHRSLKRDLERTHDKFENTEKRHESKDDIISKLRKENEILNQANLKFNQKLVEIETRIDSLTSDRNYFRKQYQESQIELDEVRRQSEKVVLGKIGVDTEIKNLQGCIESLQKEVAHHQSLEQTRLLNLTEGLERSKLAESQKQGLVREMTLLVEEKTKFLNRARMLEGELRKLEDEKHHIALEVEKLKGTVAEQSCILQEKDSNYIKLDSVCKCQEQENKTLREQVRQLEQNRELYQREARQLNEDHKEVQSKFRDVSEKANKYQISLKEELLRRERAQDELMQMRQDLTHLRRKFQILAQKEKEYQNVIQERTQSLGSLNEEIRRRDRSIQQLENAHKDVTRKFNELVESYKHLQTSYREKETETASQMNEILRLRGQIEAFIEDNGKLTSELDRRKQTLHTAANDVRSIQTEREMLRNQLLRRGEEVGRIKKALEIKTKANDKLVGKKSHLKAQIEELKKGFELLKRKYDESKQEAANYRFQLERAGTKVKSVYDTQSAFKKQNRDLNQRLKSKSMALETSSKRMAEVLRRESSLRQELESLKSRVVLNQCATASLNKLATSI